MASTRSILEQIESNVAESMGLRTAAAARPALSPIPSARDVSRRPASGFGRVAVDQVIPAPGQPRTDFDEDTLTQLADSIRTKGQLHPIHVRWSDESQKWVIICGERRWRACRLAGVPVVDCYFHERPLTSVQVLELQLIENLLRQDLKPIEEARAFESLLDQHGWTGKQLAEALHLPPSKISRSLALLDLPDELQTQVEQGELAARTGYELSKVSDDALRSTLARQATNGALSAVQAAHAVRAKKPRAPTQHGKLKQTFFTDNDWIVTVTGRVPGTYHHIEQALLTALDEVRLRIANNIRL